MATSIGAYEAKTHLAQLLDRVVDGERFVITRHGKSVALLVPLDAEDRPDPDDLVDAFHRFRRGRTLGTRPASLLEDE